MTEPPHTVVLTGGPHSGKTTLIEELRRRGERVVAEAALALIEELNGAMGVDAQIAWRRANALAFQRRVVEMQIALEREALEGAGVVFLDRGRIDGLAYCEIRGFAPPPELAELARGAPYDEVHVLDLVVPFDSRPQSGRMGTEAGARLAEEILVRTYRAWGYEPRSMPLLPVGERADLLLRRVRP